MIARRSISLSFSFIPGLYVVVLALWRLFELVQLPADIQIDPAFPPWLMAYLWTLCIFLLAIGILTIVVPCLCKHGKIKNRSAVLAIALLSIGIILVHGWFSAQDQAIGEGGFIWGVVHIITLTRTYIPDGATDAGLTGYRIGQKFGILLLGIYPFLLFLDYKIIGDDKGNDLRPAL